MKSTFKILFYISRTKPNKEGKVPVMCRITVNGTIAGFCCKLNVDPADWLQDKGLLRGDTVAVRRINRELDGIRKGVEKSYRKIFSGIGPLTAERVRASYQGLNRCNRTILQVFSQHNEEYACMVDGGLRCKSSYRKYIATYKYLSEYIHTEHKLKDVALVDLQYGFITGFETFLRQKKNSSTNTVIHYITYLRKMIAISRDNGWLDHNPFSNYHIKKATVERSYLTMREIKMMMEAEYSHRRYSMLRDFFIFCCFTGVPHVDFRNLKKSNLKKIDGKWWLSYIRKKTTVPANLMLLDIPLLIIKKYIGSTGDDRMFPMPKEAIVNKNIKNVAQQAGIKKDVTWHMARHSFASEICLANGVPIETISRMLGHTDVKTTQIYARVSDSIIERDIDELEEKLKKKFKS